ncbi:hemolysin secretion protein D [Aureimonas sp. SA4125]|uniref:efflux RND transporter periplasmic adaptor subunit n=1 Tax=Aureimonas sp. SA4125 TaxID=2826993 RepID=UPI001CC5812B|nr:efflux RND transporter periplasmic adaptor subunit [Aureimonas sp. SA4125]BDA85669.1 hemolysin secretion protein D [Aureimonas sp. SA4125]
MSKPLILLVLLTLAATGPAAAQVSASPAAASLTVTTDAVRKESVATQISATGLVIAAEEATVSATAGGLILTEVLVTEGGHVTAGQIVARLDGALIEAQIVEQQAAIASAEASFATAQSANERGQRLAKTGALSAKVAEERQTTVKTTEAALAQARAALGTLQVQLDRTVVRAPFAGIVSAKPATLGITVQTGTEITKVQRDGALRAAIDVPEQYLAGLSPGDKAEVAGPSGEKIGGTIALIGETVDSATHMGRVEIGLPQDTGLKAGMFVRATISAGGSQAMTVAESALTWRDGKTAVFVVAENNAVALKAVDAGTRQDGRVAVVGDLSEGDRVVTAGAGFLNDGNTVRVVTEQAATGETVQ